MEDFQQPKPTVKKRPVALLVVIGVVGLGLVTGLSFLARQSAFSDYNHTLFIVAKAENFGCPKMIDKSTRLDSVRARHDRIYSYYYSFVDMSAADIPNEDFCKDWETSILENIVTLKEVMEFGKNGVTITFDINDNTGEHLCTVTLPPEKYYPGAQVRSVVASCFVNTNRATTHENIYTRSRPYHRIVNGLASTGSQYRQLHRVCVWRAYR